ncbi:hypothetical protein PT2222_60283 [Paraburkholderia tropica]
MNCIIAQFDEMGRALVKCKKIEVTLIDRARKGVE